MKTKQVELWIDLYPGWQDQAETWLIAQALPKQEKQPHTKRVKILVELPVFGGSAEVDHTVTSVSEVVKEGLLKQ